MIPQADIHDMNLNGKIEKALACRRVSNLTGGITIHAVGIPSEVVEAISAVGRDCGTRNRSDTMWKAIMVYLQAYRYTRKGLA